MDVCVHICVFLKRGSPKAVIAGACSTYMCRRLPQVICSQVHSFAGNYAGSQALSIEFLLLLLFQSFLAWKAKMQQKHGCSSKQETSESKLALINVELVRVCRVNLTKVETKQKNAGWQNISERNTTGLSITNYRVVQDTIHEC